MNESQLVRTIKALIAKGEHAADKAEQFYIAAGQHLKTLKSEHTGSWEEWEEVLKTKCNISKSRASELMQIADGRKSLAEVRTGTAERAQELRQRRLSPLRNGERESLPAETWVETGRAVEIWEPDTEGHPYPPLVRRQGLLNRAADAVRLALFDDLAGLEFDEGMRRAVTEAVTAWTQTLNAMEGIHDKGKAA